MRALAVALLAALAPGEPPGDDGSLAVSIATRAERASCAVVSTATLVAYGAVRSRTVHYRFVRSDGTASRRASLTFSGEGAVAQSVSDRWIPRGSEPWVALEVLGPERMRSPRAVAASRCNRTQLAGR